MKQKQIVSTSPKAGGGEPTIFWLHLDPWPHPSHQELADRLGIAGAAPMAPPGPKNFPAALRLTWKLARDKDWDVLLSETTCREGPLLWLLDSRRRRRVKLDSVGAALRIVTTGERNFFQRWIRRMEVRTWDAFIVVGESSERALRSIVREGVEIVRWQPSVPLGDSFGAVVAKRTGPGISLIQGHVRWRVRYKGLDRVAALSKAGMNEGWGPITVYGEWTPELKKPFDGDVIFAGHKSPQEVLRGAGFLVHLSRGDSFPVAVVEAMLAGVPPVVADAGSAALVAKVEPRLVVADEVEGLEAVHWLRSMDDDTYRELGERLRAEGLDYLEEALSEAAVAEVRRVVTGTPRR